MQLGSPDPSCQEVPWSIFTPPPSNPPPSSQTPPPTPTLLTHSSDTHGKVSRDLTCHTQRHLMVGCLWKTLGCSVHWQTSGPQSPHGSVLSWSAPSLAGGSFSPSSLVTTVHYVADQNAPAISLPSELRSTQLPIALGVLSDVCWGHPSQRGTAAPLLLQASVAALFSCQLSVPRPRASPPSLGLECSTMTSLPDSSCPSVHGRKMPSNPLS